MDYGQSHGTGVRQLQMSVDTCVDEKTFVDFSLTISSLVKILVATDSSRSLLSFKLSYYTFRGLNFFSRDEHKFSTSDGDRIKIQCPPSVIFNRRLLRN